MGQKGAKLTPEDVITCRDVAEKASSSLVDEGNVKKLLAKYKATLAKTGGAEVFRSPAELQQALDSLGYFKNQAKLLRKLAKSSFPSGMPPEVKQMVNEIFDIVLLSPEGMEEQTKILFNGFDKDKDGTVDLREFLSGFLLASSNNPVERAKINFDSYDLDGNGVLTKEEVANFIITSEKAQRKITKVILAGVFTSRLMTAVARRAGAEKRTDVVVRILRKHILDLLDDAFAKIEKITEDHVNETTEKLLEYADTDKSGTLSKEEYVKYSTTPEMQKAVKGFYEKLQEDVWSKMSKDMPTLVPRWIEEIEKEINA